MELGISLSALCKDEGDQTLEGLVNSAEYCSRFGLTALDMYTNYKRDDWKDRAKQFREMMDARNLHVHQSHAPFNRYGTYGTREQYEELFSRLVSIAGILGAKYVVAHPGEYVAPQGTMYNMRKAQDYIYDILAPQVEKAKKLGMVVAVENVFHDNRGYRYGSEVEELLDLIDRFNDESVRCCWDFGHARVSFGQNDFEKFKMAFPYIVCTHVHDNCFGKDSHMIPLQGDIDWVSHMQYMNQNRYKGNLVFELPGRSFSVEKIPKVVLDKSLELVSETGKYLINL